MTPSAEEQAQLDRIESNVDQLLLLITGQGGSKQDIEHSIFYRLDAHDKWRKTTQKLIWLIAASLTATLVEIFT